MSLKTAYRPTPFHAHPSAQSAPVHSRISGVLPTWYFLNRSSSTFHAAAGYRTGSGPSGKRWLCARAVNGNRAPAAAAPAVAVRKERRFKFDGFGLDGF